MMARVHVVQADRHRIAAFAGIVRKRDVVGEFDGADFVELLVKLDDIFELQGNAVVRVAHCQIFADPRFFIFDLESIDVKRQIDGFSGCKRRRPPFALR